MSESAVNNLFERINTGRQGLNKGISTGLEKFDQNTYGIQQGWLTVVGADSGAGKSSFVLYTVIYNSFKEYLAKLGTKDEFDVKYLLFSFEMSSEILLAKILSMYIWDKYSVVLSYSDILSFNSILNEDYYSLVIKSKDWLQIFESKCTIIDKPVNADGLYAICKEWSRSFGYYTPIDSHTEAYTLNNPKLLPIVIVDHIKLLSTSTGNTIKQEIDKACDYLIYFRNKCKYCIYIVQQLNRNFKSMARRTEAGGIYAGIGLDDFSDSSGPVQAAEIVISIYHPYREKMFKCNNYDIKQLKDRARIVSILKHRFGVADVHFGMAFYGENSVWKELPLASEISDYKQYQQLSK